MAAVPAWGGNGEACQPANDQTPLRRNRLTLHMPRPLGTSIVHEDDTPPAPGRSPIAGPMTDKADHSGM
jgi:hypothetical protein